MIALFAWTWVSKPSDAANALIWICQSGICLTTRTIWIRWSITILAFCTTLYSAPWVSSPSDVTSTLSICQNCITITSCTFCLQSTRTDAATLVASLAWIWVPIVSGTTVSARTSLNASADTTGCRRSHRDTACLIMSYIAGWTAVSIPWIWSVTGQAIKAITLSTIVRIPWTKFTRAAYVSTFTCISIIIWIHCYITRGPTHRPWLYITSITSFSAPRSTVSIYVPSKSIDKFVLNLNFRNKSDYRIKTRNVIGELISWYIYLIIFVIRPIRCPTYMNYRYIYRIFKYIYALT